MAVRGHAHNTVYSHAAYLSKITKAARVRELTPRDSKHNPLLRALLPQFADTTSAESPDGGNSLPSRFIFRPRCTLLLPCKRLARQHRRLSRHPLVPRLLAWVKAAGLRGRGSLGTCLGKIAGLWIVVESTVRSRGCTWPGDDFVQPRARGRARSWRRAQIESFVPSVASM